MSKYRFSSRHAIRRKFHNKRSIISPHNKAAEDTCHQHRQQNTCYINRQKYQTSLRREECSDHHQINRQTCATRNKRIYQNCNQTRFTTFDNTRSHNSRNITSKTHNQRDERFSMQPHFVHNLIHNKSCTRHVPGVFHERNKNIEKQNIRQEHDNPSYSSYYTIYNQIFQWTCRHKCFSQRCYLLNQPLYPSFRVFSKYKSTFKHQIKKDKENRESPYFMCHNTVYDTRKHFRILILLCICFL